MINLVEMKRRNVPPRADGITWVYVLGAGDPVVACKIGIAVDLYVRLKRTASSFKDRAFPVGLHCAYAIVDGAPQSASYVESATQGRLIRWAWGHPGGDWFLLKPERGEAQLRAILAHWRMAGARRFPEAQ